NQHHRGELGNPGWTPACSTTKAAGSGPAPRQLRQPQLSRYPQNSAPRLLEFHLLNLMFPKNLRPLLPYVKRYRWGYVFGSLCVLLTNGIWILFPLVLGKAADDLHAGVTRHKLLVYAGLLLAIALVKGIF